MAWLKGIGWLLAVLAAATLLAGRLGWLAGAAPDDLGVRDGRLKPPSTTPNSVSSQAPLWPDRPGADGARIAPLPASGDGPATMSRLREIVSAMDGATVVTTRDDYLYVRFRSRVLGFVDDVEFWFDPVAQVVQVRSASRVGRKDFGVNRDRVEAIRARLAAPG